MNRNKEPCVIYRADVLSNGVFKNVDPVIAMDEQATWNTIIQTIVCPSIQILWSSLFSGLE